MTSDAIETTRRGVVTGGLAAAALALSPSPLDPPPFVSGIVFDDRTASGVRTSAYTGIHGVMVSNGVEVTVTDHTGRWQLPARYGEHVFVVKPTGWSGPRGENGLPTLSQRIEAPTPLQNIDFGLRRSEEPRRFEAALLADTQPQSMLELGYLRDSVLPAIIDSHAAFAINHGDVVFDRPDLHDRYLSLIAGTGMPWHHCPGNHDMNTGGPGTCFETWKRTFGPCHYAFQFGGATFILLNNVAKLPAGTLTKGGFDYRGQIGRDQLVFVEGILRHVPRDQLIVVSMHIPFICWEDPHEPAGFTADRTALLALLSGRPNTLSLAGHTHTTEHHYLGPADGFSGPGTHHHHVLTAACGSWWSGPFDTNGQPMALSRDGTPNGFHVLEVDGSSYTTRFVAAGSSGQTKMRIGLEGAAATSSEQAGRRRKLTRSLCNNDCPSASVVVNVFDGGPRTKVTCRISGTAHNGTVVAATFTLSREAIADVAVEDIYTRHRDQIKPWVEPAISSHLWRARLPMLAVGTYNATVEVLDEYGRKHTSSLVFERVS
jgi:3',5'-cyclic AMP phosphodiesterase CpdA